MDFLQLQIVGATLGCGIQASHCGDFSCCRARALSPWASVVVAPGLSCSTECGIFPDQGLNPCPLHWQADSLPLSHQGSPFFGFDIKVMLANRISWGMSSLLLVSKTISERLGYFFFMYLVELISDDIWTPKF